MVGDIYIIIIFFFFFFFIFFFFLFFLFFFFFSFFFFIFFFFFFQAEDGIRDVAVTGVQTCALPISLPRRRQGRRPAGGGHADRPHRRADLLGEPEERRVGKECRSRWSPYH